MKKLILLLALASTANAYEITGKVVHITDGDTVKILDSDNVQHKIRLYGIDTPEKKQPYGNKAKQMLAVMIAGKNVVADCSKKDRYKRDICVIYSDNKDINAEMVKKGGAWVYRKYYKGTAYYEYEEYAKTHKLGLWSTSEYHAIAPWQWRKQQKRR